MTKHIFKLGRIASLSLVVMMLAACTTGSGSGWGGFSSRGGSSNRDTDASTRPHMQMANDPVALALVDAAERTSTALDRLSIVESTRTPVDDPGPIVNPPPGLDTYLAVSWVGPIAPLVAKLADAAGYQFRVVGRPPAVALVVDVSTDGAQILEVLRNVGHQAGARAHVAINPDQRIIEVRYAP